MGIFQNHLMGAAAAASAGGADFYDYQIQHSARFLRTGDNTNTYLKRTPSSAGNRKTYTLSLWVKRTQTTTLETFASAQVTSTTNYVDGYKFGSAQYDNSGLSLAAKGTLSGSLITSAAYRDLSAWMHIVIRVDSTQTTAANRFRLYVNGEQVTAFGTETYIAEDYEGGFCSTREHAIGWGTGANNGQGFFGYMAEVILADGTSYAPTQFGETKNGVWIPKDPDGTSFGTTGFHLDFASSSDLGNDVSGNNNDFTNVGMSAHDQMLDTPTFDSSSNGGNFCVMNPLNSGSNNTFSEGNLKVTNSSGGCSALGTMSLITGHKWYFEGKLTGSGNNWIGIIEENGYTNSANTNSSIAGSSGFNNYLYGYNGSIYYGANSSATGATMGSGDIMGVLVDLESATNTIQFYKNGAAQGSAFNLTGTGINYTPMSDRGSGSGDGFIFNFGQDSSFAGAETAQTNSDATGYGSFYYDDGASAKAICTGNLPVADAINPALTDDDFPQKLFDAKLYTGDGTSSNAITGVGFQPDFVWIKSRSAAENHNLYDSTRGANKRIKSNTTGGETTEGLPSFDSDGFTVDAGGTICNVSSRTYVGWTWRINGGTTSSNSNGSVTSTVQVDPSGAFSLVKYRGGLTGAGAATVGHGLSKAPSLIIFKGYGNLSGGDGQWWVGSDELTSWNYFIRLNTTADEIDKSGNGSMASPTSTVFSVNNTDGLGAGTIDNLAYCFTNVEGYCKTGGYTGNANDDGAFVYTGFRPAWILMREIATDNWGIYDDKRIGQNDDSGSGNAVLYPDTNNDEENQASRAIDLLSNGFKLRTSNATFNASGNYVYLAFAENPFKYATAR